MKTHWFVVCAGLLPVLFCGSLAAEEKESFNATFIDRMDVTSRVHNIEFRPNYMDREVTKAKHVLYGWRGSAQITVPWNNIRRIDFVNGDKRFNAVVTLRDGRRIHLRIDPANSEYEGLNDFGGVFLIRTQYIRAIIFD